MFLICDEGEMWRKEDKENGISMMNENHSVNYMTDTGWMCKWIEPYLLL